jgi:hypothetical protein
MKDVPGALMKQGLGKQGIAVGKSLAEQKKAQLDQLKTTGEVLSGRASRIMVNPTLENAITQVAAFGRDTGGDVSAEIEALRQMGNDPKKIFEWSKGYAMKGIELVNSSETARHNRATEGFTRERLQKDFDPEVQAKLVGAKEREKGKVAQEIQGQVDVKANRKALATAGYDPVTGKDNISKLIQDSTGSFAGAGTDLAGRVIGVSTKGAQSIAQLKTFESKLTQDILGGKLGAGISNTDREFIVAAIGQIADSTLPVETRQAAWNSVKERMRVAGMVEAPKAPANNVNVPGVGSQVNTPGGAAAPAARPSLDDIFKPKK